MFKYFRRGRLYRMGGEIFIRPCDNIEIKLIPPENQLITSSKAACKTAFLLKVKFTAGFRLNPAEDSLIIVRLLAQAFVQRLFLLLISGFAQKREHIALIGLDPGLVEWIYSQNVA